MQFFMVGGGAADTSYFASTKDISRLRCVCVCGGGGGGWRYKACFVFALLLCDFMHPEQFFVVFCSNKELPGPVFFSSLRISALLCEPSLISSVAAN